MSDRENNEESNRDNNMNDNDVADTNADKMTTDVDNANTGGDDIYDVESDESWAVSIDDGNTETTEDVDAQGEDSGRLRIDDTIEREERSLMRKSLFGLAIIGSIGLGVGGAFLYDSYQRDQDAVTELAEFAESRGELTLVNSDVVEYDSGGEGDSYALGVGSAVGGGDAPDFGTFIIGNENEEFDRTVNLYLDYADPRSRDFLFMNQHMLQTLVENGQIELRIHPVPSSHPYSMYAAEALSQVAHRHPESFWSVSTSLLQLNDEVSSIDEEVSASVFGDMIENELNRYHNIEDIDQELIVEGMFFDWLGNISEDDMLTSGGVPPIIYSDGQLLDNESYYEPEELRENIVNAESSVPDADDEEEG